MRIIPAVFLALFSAHVFAASIQIQGNGIEYREKTLKVMKYEDLFTFEAETIAETRIGDDGNFNIEVPIEETTLLLLKIGRTNAHLFAEPGVKYTLILPPPPIEELYDLGKDPFILPEVFETGGNMNRWITTLERDLNAFAMASSMAINASSKQVALEHLEDVVAKYEDVQDPYFREYLQYRSIEFRAVHGGARSSSLLQEFLESGVNHQQLSFSNALHALFSEHLAIYSIQSFSDSARLAIENGSYALLNQVLQTNASLSNDTLRELVIITELAKLTHERKYPLMTTLEIMKEAQNSTRIPEHLVILENTIGQLTYLMEGTEAPNFSFQSVEGENVDLRTYRNRVVYVQFFDRLTPEALRQMSLMKVLKKGYGEDIAMFSLSVGMSAAEIKSLSSRYKFGWFFGSINDPALVAEIYRLRSYPAYFLIDEQGMFIASPAPIPGARIERRFAQLYEKKYPGRNKPFKLQPPEVTEEVPPFKK